MKQSTGQALAAVLAVGASLVVIAALHADSHRCTGSRRARWLALGLGALGVGMVSAVFLALGAIAVEGC